MECLDTINSLKINFKRNIGTVIIIVEGEKDEFNILKRIFRDILHYRYIEKKRNKRIKDYDEFIMQGNENSKVIVINLKNSNIKNIENDIEYKNQIFNLLYDKYNIDIKNVPIYYLWDRDTHSNSKQLTEKLITSLGNAYENNDYDINGMLLLSYPSIESFVIENFDMNIDMIKSNNIKNYLKKKKYSISNINKHTLLKSVVKLHKNLLEIGIDNYDTSNFSNTSMNIFNYQESLYKNKGYYKILSLLAIILIDLNIT